jgi:hypothetical protein
LGDIIWLPGKDLASSEAKSGSPLHRGPSTKTHAPPSHTIPSHQAQAPSSPAAASISETYELLAACCYHLFAMVETLPRAAPARASPARSCPPPVLCILPGSPRLGDWSLFLMSLSSQSIALMSSESFDALAFSTYPCSFWCSCHHPRVTACTLGTLSCCSFFTSLEGDLFLL